MIEVVNFKPEHMVNIKKDDPETGIFLFIGEIDKRAEAYAKSGPAITLLEDGEVIAIGGVVKFWEGVGETWMMVSPEGRKRILALYRYMNAFIQACFTKYKFHRLEAKVLQEHKIAHKCIMRLGFIPEGMMLYYGPNKENFVRYVRL